MELDMAAMDKGSGEVDEELPESASQNEDLYIGTPNLGDYKRSSSGQMHAYNLRAQGTSLSTPMGTTTFVGRRQRSLTSEATCTLLVPRPEETNVHRAGLAVYKDSLRYRSIYLDLSTRTIVLESKSLGNSEPRILKLSKTLDADSTSIKFKITSEPGKYSFFWGDATKDGDEGWTIAAEVDSMLLSARDMTGTIFGIFADKDEATNQSDKDWITFEDFSIM